MGPGYHLDASRSAEWSVSGITRFTFISSVLEKSTVGPWSLRASMGRIVSMGHHLSKPAPPGYTHTHPPASSASPGLGLADPGSLHWPADSPSALQLKRKAH